MPSRICSACKADKPLDQFNKNARDKRYGKDWMCRPCSRERLRRYRIANPERVRAWDRKKHEENRPARLAAMRKYNRENREAMRKRSKAYHQANRDRQNARRRARYQERIEEERANARERHRLNPAKGLARAKARQAKKKGARIGCRKAYARFIQRVRNARRIRCYWCASYVPKARRHIDHIIPLSRGGADSVENLCCACADCNQHKHTAMPIEFSGQAEIPFGLIREDAA